MVVNVRPAAFEIVLWGSLALLICSITLNRILNHFAGRPLPLSDEDGKLRVIRLTFRSIASLGVVLPWSAALAARTWLDFQGKSVMTWLEIWLSAPLFALLALLFALPHLLLAFSARRILRHHLPMVVRTNFIAIGGLIGALIALSVTTLLMQWGLWIQTADIRADLLAFGLVPCALALLGITCAGSLLGQLVTFVFTMVTRRPPLVLSG